MTRTLLTFILLLLAPGARAAIAYVGGTNVAAVSNTQTLTYTITAGNAVVVGVTYDNTTCTFSSISDDGGNVYTRQILVADGYQQDEIIYTAINAVAATVITVTLAACSANTFSVAAVAEYSGVAYIGPNVKKTASLSTLAMTLPHGNDWLVMMSVSATAGSITVGNERQNKTSTGPASLILGDNTDTTAVSVTVTSSGSGSRGAVMIHLVASGNEEPIYYVGVGTQCAVTATTCTPTIPTELVDDDILIAVLHSRTNTAHTCTTNCTGWTEFSTQDGAATGGRVSVWYLRRSGAPAGNPTFGGPATESYAGKIWAFRGVYATGDPYDTKGSNTAQAAAATFTGDNLSTSTANTMIVMVGGTTDNNTWGAAGGTATVPLGATTVYDPRMCVSNASGTDNSVFIAFDESATNSAGSQGAPTNTQASLGNDAGRSFTFALRTTAGGTPTVPQSMMGFWGALLNPFNDRLLASYDARRSTR